MEIEDIENQGAICTNKIASEGTGRYYDSWNLDVTDVSMVSSKSKNFQIGVLHILAMDIRDFSSLG